MKTTCKCHCSDCDRHFSGLSAFDAHRTGEYGHPLRSLEGRRCKSVETDPAFVGDQGECRVTSREVVSPVLIWALAADRARLAEVFPKDKAAA